MNWGHPSEVDAGVLRQPKVCEVMQAVLKGKGSARSRLTCESVALSLVAAANFILSCSDSCSRRAERLSNRLQIWYAARHGRQPFS